ncbi:CoA transferase [Microbacterium terrisoli]|uniref:CoA transferase n=1 Tax=Microbacterium terrisoli TaxID=3242192 RepID=UPI002803FCB7|nr:CoA transferase [Microbacterium protaetiae]
MIRFPDPADAVARSMWAALGRDANDLSAACAPSRPVPLPAHTDVPSLAWAAAIVASLAAARLAGAADVVVDPDRVAVAYTSDRLFRMDGALSGAFAALSGFFRCTDGWVRTHGNYPHHAAALRAALALPADGGRTAAAAALSRRTVDDAVRVITRSGGLCVAVAYESRVTDERLRTQPIISVRGIHPSPAVPTRAATADAPLRGIRVLDLTRVIAGPVGTRTLALLGADVLRIDPPHMPEIVRQHLDTGHGKRSTLLDLTVPAQRAVFDELLATADVVALGYRPTALARLGLTSETLAERRPGIIVARHSAWGNQDADAPDRRGFDSLVQANCGIAVIEGGPDAPGALPAQALDHTTGYLLAAGVITALARREAEGGSWVVETSLRRVAAELLGLGRTPTVAATPAFDIHEHMQTFDVEGHRVTTAVPAIAYTGGPLRFAAPRPWGRDAPEWMPR